MVNNFQLGNSGPLNPVKARVRNQLVPYDANFAKAQRNARALNMAKTAYKYGQWVPYIGDVADIVYGGYKLSKGDKSGWGNITLGGAGLLLPGAGKAMKAVGKAGIKAGEKIAAKAMTKAEAEALKRAGYTSAEVNLARKISGGAANLRSGLIGAPSRVIHGTGTALDFAGGMINKPQVRLPMDISLEVLSRLNNGGDNISSNNNQQPQDTTQMGNSNNQPTTSQGNIVRTGGVVPGGYYRGGYSGVVNPQAVNQAINNTTTAQQPIDVENNSQSSTIDPGEIYRRYLDKQEALEPYRRGLQNYVRDYHRLSDLSYNQDKYLALLAAQTGASGLNNMIGKYTALGDEAKALDLQKLYGSEIKNVGEGLDKLQGNITMAQQMGLPIESVLADDDYVKLALQKEMASDKLENALLRLQMNWDYRNALENQKHQWRLQTPKFSSGSGKGKATQKTTMGAWNVYNDLVDERGIDPITAANYVNSTFGSSIKPLQVNSTNLYSGRTLHR